MFTGLNIVAAILFLVSAVDLRGLNDVPDANDLIDLVQNFSTEWKKYMETWTSYHETVPAEVLGYQKFTCNLSTSYPEILNVHMLRPGDIGVIAALGDSLTAANGAGGHKLIDVGKEYRGLSFPIGGDGSLEDTLTLANILRKYNPGIYGASTAIGPADFEPNSQLNVAVPGSKAKDMPDQARELVNRVEKATRFKDMWKVVTLFIGSNDVCQYCQSRRSLERDFVSKWIKDIDRAINILSKGLTKTFLNLVPVPPVGNLRLFEEDHVMCKALHKIECPCITSTYPNHTRSDEINRSYQSRLFELIGKYDRWDFTAIVQPFLTKVSVPINKERNEVDLSYLSPDCFHFNRRSHAAAAADLWNNMVQAVGAKGDTIDPSVVDLQCPDQDCPYFRTHINSIDCSTEYILAVTQDQRQYRYSKSSLINGKHENTRIQNLANNESQTAVISGPGPAIWIFAGLLVTLILGIVLLYCTYRDRSGVSGRKRKVADENTPLIMRSIEAM